MERWCRTLPPPPLPGSHAATDRSDEYVLRVDTNISCSSASYRRFRIVDGAIIFLYTAAMLALAAVVLRHRSILNPADLRDDSLRYKARESNPTVRPLLFLFGDYRCEYYFFEFVDMYGTLLTSLRPVHCGDA